MAAQGCLRNEDVERLVEIRKKVFQGGGDGAATQNRRSVLLGKILVAKGLATEYQVNERLRLQGRMSVLGEILLRRNCVDKGALETALLEAPGRRLSGSALVPPPSHVRARGA